MKLKDRIGELHQSSGGSQPLAVMAILLAVGAISLLVPILVREILSEGQKRIEYYEAQQRCAETRNRIGRLFAAVQAAQRGFLLTGRKEFLSPYEQAARELPGRLDALGIGVSGTSLKPAVRRLGELVPATIDELARAIDIYRQRGPAAAAKIVAEGRGNR